tara:strand:- start:6119 stop:6433 length:315 start_codon:yes stop_codon:yes gene_type:complete
VSEFDDVVKRIYGQAKVGIDDQLDRLAVTSDELRARSHLLALNYTEVSIRQASGEDVTESLAALEVSASALKASAGMAVASAVTGVVLETLKTAFLTILRLAII